MIFDEYIGRLDIPMDKSLFDHNLKSKDYLIKSFHTFALSKFPQGQLLSKITIT